MSHFKILSIDGGGMKGLFSAAFLASIESFTGKTLVDHFDLIVGTSTGGIIALSLGLGMSARDILGFYLTEGHRVFPTSLAPQSVRLLSHLFRPKYRVGPLEVVLKRHFGKSRLGDSRTRLVIPSFNPATGDVYLYKTAHHPRLREDYKELVWKVARGTSAAPSFFRSHRTGFLTDIVDGGVWANNPSMVAVTEAIGLLQQSPADIAMLSIGTALSKVSIGAKTRQSGGLLRWGLAVSMHLFMHVQAVTAHKQAFHILERGRYVRIDPSACDLHTPMDDAVRTRDLIPFGEQAARHFRPIVEDLFLAERVKTFVPDYSLGSHAGQGVRTFSPQGETTHANESQPNR